MNAESESNSAQILHFHFVISLSADAGDAFSILRGMKERKKEFSGLQHHEPRHEILDFLTCYLKVAESVS